MKDTFLSDVFETRSERQLVWHLAEALELCAVLMYPVPLSCLPDAVVLHQRKPYGRICSSRTHPLTCRGPSENLGQPLSKDSATAGFVDALAQVALQGDRALAI